MPEPVPDLLAVSLRFGGGGGFLVKVAVAVRAWLIVTPQVNVDPAQAPDQPVKVDPEAALAVRVICVPWR